ncbi:MAG: UbiA prenyltransferase family protein [Alphaproteobacteria bacterium]|nr:UbiA prenyltransferase family protein [Alphaproteobacteria bacterium]
MLIFFPILFSFNEYSNQSITNSIYVFISFCFVSSGIYIFNDIQDANLDKKNIRTKNRPIASGEISHKSGYILSILLIILSFLILIIHVPECLFFISLYIIINILYSIYLKYLVLLDAIAVSSGFIIRILAGGVAAGISQSLWTLLIIAFSSISFALGKRLGQLVINNDYLSANWNKKLLKVLLLFSILCTLIFYGLFSFDSTVALRHESNIIWISFPVIIAIFTRYLYIAWNGIYTGDPMDSILKDKTLQSLALIWCIIIFYLFII